MKGVFEIDGQRQQVGLELSNNYKWRVFHLRANYFYLPRKRARIDIVACSIPYHGCCADIIADLEDPCGALHVVVICTFHH